MSLIGPAAPVATIYKHDAAPSALLRPGRRWSMLLVAPAQGAVHRQMLIALAENPDCSHVGVLVRHEMPASQWSSSEPSFDASKVQQMPVDFAQLQQSRDAFAGYDAVVYCVDAQADSTSTNKELATVAALAKAASIPHFNVVSSASADTASLLFSLYPADSTQSSETIDRFRTLSIYRPGVLKATRADGASWGERMEAKLTSLFAGDLPEQHKTVRSATVAQAVMLHTEHAIALEKRKQSKPSLAVFNNAEIRQLRVARL